MAAIIAYNRGLTPYTRFGIMDTLGRVAAHERKELEMKTFMEHLAATSAAIPAEMSVPEIAEAAWLASQLMHKLAEHAETDTVTEAVGGAFGFLPPHILAPIIMQSLPHSGNPMTSQMKHYWLSMAWLSMAEELGPDWLKSFRTAANWMRMAEGFK